MRTLIRPGRPLVRPPSVAAPRTLRGTAAPTPCRVPARRGSSSIPVAAPSPVEYGPRGADALVQADPTSLRAWNGEMTRETRTVDQTRVEVSTGADGARRWQFFWRTKDAKPRAARWEISTAPFVDDANHF